MSSGQVRFEPYFVALNGETVATHPSQYGSGGGDSGSGDPDDGRKSIHNEQIKLRATFLNTTGAGCVIAGFITPLTAIGVGTSSPIASVNEALALMACWLVGAFILHNGGMLTLEATI